MKNHKLIKLNILTAISIIMILGCSFVVSIQNYKKLDFRFTSNSIREELNIEREQINTVFLEQPVSSQYPQSQYPYIVIDTRGKVYYVNKEWKLTVGDSISVEEIIQQDHSFSKQYADKYKYSLVLNDNDQCCGFLVYQLPMSKITKNIYGEGMVLCFLPVGIGIVISILLVLLRTIYCNKRILRPIQMVHDSADAIIKGNYDIEVQRIFETKLQTNEIGNLIYSFELMRDELKTKQESEQALKKSQQELISCISHDLRTPISTIKAYSEGIRDGIAANSDQSEEFLSIIIKKTNLLEGMITELLEYSNTQLNKMSICKKDVYLLDYMTDVVHELRIYVTQKHVAFESMLPEQNALVFIDTKRITEVLYNLVENSLKYLGNKEGKINIYVKMQESFVEIHVQDNGMGISAEDIPYVFDKFYRAEKSRSSNISGSGLGLSICKYIVEQHGGEINCQSRKSKGCDFWFTLPL